MTSSGASSGPTRDPVRLRNVGIVAHINAGKTTLSERILYDTGRQRFCGDVEAGTATMDWLREEQERGISIQAGITWVDWQGFRIQLVDTPGHVDFSAEVERSLRVLDGAIVLLDGVRGVESQTEAAWTSLDRLAVPRVVFVNKLDRPTADYDAAVQSLRDRFDAPLLPVVTPVFHEAGIRGVVDAVGRRARVWEGEQPSSSEAMERHAELLAILGEFDDEVMEAYVEGRALEPDVLHPLIRRLTLEGAIVPVMAGSALQNRGVEPVLDVICRYLPSPLDRRIEAVDPAGSGLVSLVFRGEQEAEGPIAMLRIYRGRLAVGARVETASGLEFEVEHMYQLHAAERAPIERAGPGDIVAIATPAVLRTGETVRAIGGREELEPVEFAEPVITMSLEPASSDQVQQLEAVARQVAGHDPTLEVSRNPQTGELLVSGMGELHLEVFGEQLDRAMAATVRRGRPQVLRFQGVREAAEAEAVCERALGEETIRATVIVHVEPAAEGDDVRFRWAASEDGWRRPALSELERLAAYGHEGRPAWRGLVVEIRSIETAGATEVVEPLVQEAVGLAASRAMREGGELEFEPRVRFVIRVPNEAVHVVMADLRGRGVSIDAVEADPEVTRVEGRAFLAELLGYATPLRSATRGKGQIEIQLDGFAPRERVPDAPS